MIEKRADGRGYNPNRDAKGRFASGSGSGPRARKAKRSPAARFNAEPHRRRIAALAKKEAEHRRASIAIKAKMSALKKTARATTPKQREALKKRYERLAARRATLKAKADQAKAARREARAKMQSARSEFAARKSRKTGRRAAPNQTSEIPNAAARDAIHSINRGDFNSAGRSLDDVLKQRGFVPRDPPNGGVVVSDAGLARPGGTARGVRFHDGEVQLSTTVAAQAKEYAAAVGTADPSSSIIAAERRYEQLRSSKRATARDRSAAFGELQQARRQQQFAADQAHGLRTFVHERAHGFGPGTRLSYQGHGAQIEEITTEVSARGVMRDVFRAPIEGGAYDEQVSAARRAVAEVTGFAGGRADEVLTRASERYKRRTERFIFPEETIMAFSYDLAAESGASASRMRSALEHHLSTAE